MIETADCEASAAPVHPPADVHSLIDSLRRDGVHQFDPVRFHYIEVLAQRASAQQASVQRILEGKLESAVAALRMRFEQARSEGQGADATADAAAHRQTLGDLVRHIAKHSPGKMDSRLDAPVAPRVELKSVRYFRNTWSKLSAEKQVAKALDQAPKNAGPINSHVVVLRSLALMRDISPDYLNRFMSYVDTLLCLDQGDKGALPIAKPTRAAKTARK